MDLLGNIGADWVSAEHNQDLATQMQNQAQSFSAQQFAQRYQTQTADMKAAGLNPMLAAGQSPGSGPSGTAGQPGKVDYANTINQAKLANAQEANMAADTDKKSAERDEAKARAANVNMDTMVKEGMPRYYGALINEAQQNAGKAHEMQKQIKAQIPVLEQEKKRLETQQEKDRSDVKLNASLVDVNQRLATLKIAETHLTNAKTDVVNKEAQILTPKAKAAGMATGQGAAIAENVWKIITPPNPFSGGGNMGSRYPRKVK